MKKVSVIVPVYNVEQYLNECLESLVNQTLEEIEIIVVNDGSPDNSQDIIDEYVEKYPTKIRSFIKENGGISDARNYGIKKAVGEYIGFVDSDDYVDVTMFEKLYKQASIYKSDIVVCDFIKDYGNSLQRTRNIRNWSLFDSKILENPVLLFHSKPYAWNKLYKRNMFLDNNMFFPVGQCFEDSAIIYNILYLANKITCVKEQLYYYRVNRLESITNTVNRKMFDIFKSCTSIISFYSKQKEYEEKLFPIIERLCLVHLFARLKAFIRSDEKQLSLEFARNMYDFLDEYLPNWKKNKYFVNSGKHFKNKKFNFLVKHKSVLLVYLRTPKNIRVNIRKSFNKVIRKKKRKKTQLSNERLRELQLIELDILLEVDKICKKHNITYYLGEGTLLGAIRHQGFIPWDDDLDILMFREDYNKFMNIAKKELPPDLVLLNNTTFRKYYLPFTKVITKQTRGFVNTVDVGLKGNNGPYIDVFPVDYVMCKESSEQDKVFKKIRYYRDLLLFKVGYKRVNTYKKLFLKILSKLLTFKFLQNRIHKLSTRNNNKKCKYAANLASSYSPVRQIVRKKVYGKPQYVKFEGHDFPVPRDYHKLLRTIYGDYEVLPPVHLRVPRHSFYDELSEQDNSNKNIKN